ncbi:MAG: response regulator [Leptolyngbyaceae cyanobacterium SL_7_1]|nr:response regulator [Leptolyngbyaceae cyanobacterium SL_7_1]
MCRRCCTGLLAMSDRPMRSALQELSLVGLLHCLREWFGGLVGRLAGAIAAPPAFNDFLPVVPIPPEERSTILVVDDSINVRRLLALTLEKAGYQVMQAKDGQDAVDKLTAGLEVQAVICDIEMPRLDGYGFLARLKSNPTLAHLPVTMLTSRSNEKHRQLAMKLGAVAYFSKPYNEQTLLQTLEQLIQARSAI